MQAVYLAPTLADHGIVVARTRTTSGFVTIDSPTAGLRAATDTDKSAPLNASASGDDGNPSVKGDN